MGVWVGAWLGGWLVGWVVHVHFVKRNGTGTVGKRRPSCRRLQEGGGGNLRAAASGSFSASAGFMTSTPGPPRSPSWAGLHDDVPADFLTAKVAQNVRQARAAQTDSLTAPDWGTTSAVQPTFLGIVTVLI